jgi:flagellar export protein FliJ
MKAFRFTLEAVRTVRQRQENEALELYARALLARQQAQDLLVAIHQRIGEDFALMRPLLAGGCTAAQATQAQNYHLSLEKLRDEYEVSLGQADRRVKAASQAMLAARQQREIVDVYRKKQHAVHQRAELREEQKIMDEFAIRRVTALNSAQSHSEHD